MAADNDQNPKAIRTPFPPELPDSMTLPFESHALRALLDASPLAIVTLGYDGHVVSWNRAAERMFGWTAKEIIGQQYPLMSMSGGREEFVTLRERLRAIDSYSGYECRRPRRDGTLLDVSVSAGAIRNDKGRLTGAIAIIADISRQKALEAERDQLFEHSHHLLAICGIDGQFRRVNSAWTRILGYETADLIGRQFLEIVHPEDQAASVAYVGGLPTASSVGFENRCRTKDGTYRWIMWRGTVVPERDCFYGYGTDITDRKTFEQELWAAHADTERLLASLSAIIIGVDDELRISRWNSLAEDAFGIDSFAAVGQPFATCGIPWNDARVGSHIFTMGEAPVRLEDVRYTGRDGDDRFVTLTVNSMRGGKEGADGFVLVGSDVTERRIMEQQLRQAQKLEGIGQLAAGIAHEINTPTQYVGDNLRFLQDALQSSMGLLASISRLRGYARETAECGTLLEEIHELAEEAERSDHDYLMEEAPRAIAQALDGVQRVAMIVRAMKDFSHPHHENKVPFDLNRAIETTLIVAHNELKYVADVVTDLDATLPLVPCLPGEINQVILNLLINAAHAIGDANRGASGKRGTITVSTRRIDDVAEMRITDTGTGIPEGARDRIFEPFFTTKDVGRGTGQGLAIAHTVVVKKHGGQIRFETQTGQGTTFIVRLPLPQADVAAA